MVLMHTAWDVIEANTELFVCFGGITVNAGEKMHRRAGEKMHRG